MSRENPLWGAPKIHGELLNLGIEIGETSVSKYIVRRTGPPSQTRKTFLENHVRSMVSVDFFVVPTTRFQLLYVSRVLAHQRRRIVHFAVAAHPTAEWTAQQMREAFPWESAPRYLLRDPDRIFGKEFVDQVKAMGVRQMLSAQRSPWQGAYVERVIGAIRRECLDHVIVVNERCLYRHLRDFIEHYHGSRTHLALQKDSPDWSPPLASITIGHAERRLASCVQLRLGSGSAGVAHMQNTGIHAGKDAPESQRYDKVISSLPLIGMQELLGRHAQFYTDWIRHPDYDDYWKAINVEEVFDNIATPVHTHCGWYDIFLQGTLNGYVGMSKSSKALRSMNHLVVGPWEHGVLVYTSAPRDQSAPDRYDYDPCGAGCPRID